MTSPSVLVNGAFYTSGVPTGFTRVPLRLQQDGSLIEYPLDLAQNIIKTPTVTNGTPYAAGDNVGGKFTQTGLFRVKEAQAWLKNLLVIDRNNQKAALRFLFFDRDPTSATLTNDAALALGADGPNVTAYVEVLASDYVTVDPTAGSPCALAQIWNLNIPLISSVTDGSAAGNLYWAMMTTGTPTYTTALGLGVKLGLSSSGA